MREEEREWIGEEDMEVRGEDNDASGEDKDVRGEDKEVRGEDWELLNWLLSSMSSRLPRSEA